ncbi:MAG: hypothetical protein K2G20_03730, partial [Lachnospiraceae bacterium]|nr:hypothetical protein [Lachnospiraceae bacterium]
MRGNILLKRITAVLLAGTMALGLAACGSGGNGGGNSENGGSSAGSNGGGSTTLNAGGEKDDGDYVYIPSFYDLPRDAEADSVQYSSVSFVGNRMYYKYQVLKNGYFSNDYCYVDMDNPEAEPVVVMGLAEYEVWTQDSASSVIMAVADEDGGTILLLSTSPLVSGDATAEELARQERDITYSIKKLAADGTEVFDTDVTEYL